MSEQEQLKRRIPWHRTRIDRRLLAELNRRSDLLGFAQTLGYLATLTATGAFAWWVSVHFAWYWFAAAVFLHGTCCAFSVNGFHELCHNSVFRTRSLNVFFLHVLSFIGWHNPVLFWASHSEHHKYTLYPPEDGEVVLPVEMTLKGYLRGAFVDYWGFYQKVRMIFLRACFHRLSPGWHTALFPPENAGERRRLFRWDRFLLSGHAAIAAGAVWSGWWQVLPLFTFATLFGRWLFLLCNSSQHVGLTDEVPDFRQNSRTFHLNPVVRFLYWHMNYHIEHHMYAAVPCYRLGRLHRAIRHELPHCHRGLVPMWREIAGILRRQKREPGFQFVPELPEEREAARAALT